MNTNHHETNSKLSTRPEHDQVPLAEQEQPQASADALDVASLVPAVDVLETDGAWLIVADMPGLDASAIDVRLDNDVLHVSGLSRVEGLAPVRYERSFRVMRGLDPDGIVAAYRDGVLSVTLPRPVNQGPRRIQVSVD